ncbi:MAG: PhoH family protein, partial [Bacteroidetes bacterium]
MIDKKIIVEGVDMVQLLGLNDANLHAIEDKFDASIFVRGNQLTFRGEEREVEQLEKVFKELAYIINKNGSLTMNDVDTVIDLVAINGEG